MDGVEANEKKKQKKDKKKKKKKDKKKKKKNSKEKEKDRERVATEEVGGEGVKQVAFEEKPEPVPSAATKKRKRTIFATSSKMACVPH